MPRKTRLVRTRSAPRSKAQKLSNHIHVHLMHLTHLILRVSCRGISFSRAIERSKNPVYNLYVLQQNRVQQVRNDLTACFFKVNVNSNGCVFRVRNQHPGAFLTQGVR